MKTTTGAHASVRGHHPVERFTLGNGLRVVLSPQPGAQVVGVAVVYDVGIRSEPQGRTGFAHLFEHLMFQGSANLAKLEHFRHVQGAGGTFNGSTHLDYTEYFQTVPAGALELMLFLEADRMRGPVLTPEKVRNQIDVVKQEIRVNVQNRPYGGFPWLRLPPVLFDTFPNAHDGYGSFEDLEAAGVPEATAFFDKYYASGNAVLSVVGGFTVEQATRLIASHFGDVPARPAPAVPRFFEPDLAGPRHRAYLNPAAPTPMLAAAWRVPDPIDDLHGYLPYAVLAEVLTDGLASRLVERLIHRQRTATGVSGYLGFMGDAFDVRDPTALILQINLPPGGTTQPVLAAIDEELRRLACQGLTPGELPRVQARMAAQLLRHTDAVSRRAVSMAVLELQRGDPSLINRLPSLIGAVTQEQVRAAAATLGEDRRASAEIVPGGAR